MVFKGAPVARRFVAAVMSFSVAALIGPTLRWATWPSSIQGFFTPIQSFVHDLVILIWPAQVFWDGETTSSLAANLFWSVGGNVFLYCVLGVVAGALASHPRRLLALYVFVCAWGLLIVLTLKEYKPAYYDLLAVTAAWLIFAIPFLAIAYFVKMENQQRESKGLG